ncbi:MAG: hypothetical protein ACJ78Q_18745 [Chloroflexia bacterium]
MGEHARHAGGLASAVIFAGACAALVLLAACDLTPFSSGQRAFPTATALSRSTGSEVMVEPAAAGDGVAAAAPARPRATSTIPPLLTVTPTPTLTPTPGTPPPTQTPTKTLTPFATPTRYPTATRIPAPPTVTPRGEVAQPEIPAPPTGRPTEQPAPAPAPGPPPPGGGSTAAPPSAPPAGVAPPLFVDVGEAAARNGLVFMVTRVDKTAKRIDVIYRLTNQSGHAVSFAISYADQRILTGGSTKSPADPTASAAGSLQNGQSYDSGTTFYFDTSDPDNSEVTFAIDNLPGIGSVRVRIRLGDA